MSLVENAACTICHKPQNNHPYHHAFASPGGSSALVEKEVEEEAPPDTPLPAQPAQPIRLPSMSDPVLRMVLIRQGLISVDDIEMVEKELRATGVAGYEPPKTLG